jgi:hypothetical protein
MVKKELDSLVSLKMKQTQEKNGSKTDDEL